MRDQFDAMDKRIASEILSAVTRCRRRMDDHDIYRQIMDEVQTQLVNSDWFGAHRASPLFESAIARIQRMVFAALAISRSEHRRRSEISQPFPDRGGAG
jgi:hypothetical protein